MRLHGVLTWFTANRHGLILGLVVGVIAPPFLAMFGLVIASPEVVRPLLIGPFDLMGSFIPSVLTSPNSGYIPWYKWILTLGFNGICYSMLGGIVQSVIRFWASTRER